jgi:preprotein translocase subunit SecG
MKRITFVLAGIIMITAFILSQKNLDDNTTNFVKVDTNKYKLKGVYR